MNQNSTPVKSSDKIEENFSLGDSPSSTMKQSMKRKGHRRIGSGSKKTYESTPTRTVQTQTDVIESKNDIEHKVPRDVK